MTRKILLSTLLSLTLLSANTSVSTDIICKDGKCFIDLSKLKKIDKVVPFNNVNNMVVLEIDENIIRLPHDKYVMTEIEKERYEVEQMEREDLLEILAEINAIDIEESALPVSEKYCDIQNAIYNSKSNTYECS